MGNCLKYEDCKNCNEIDKYLLENHENKVQLFSKEKLIEYDGQLNNKGQYDGYGKEYDCYNGIIKDGFFVEGKFTTGYVKYCCRNWSLDKIEYYDDGEFIRILY